MIDKEGKALVEDVRKALIQYGRQTKSSSVKKKTRKVTSQLIWSAEEYVDALDNIKATSKTETEMIERVRSLIRTAEEDALEFMTVTPDDTGHHLVQSRTGGDALTDISYERSGPIISRLSDKHQRTFGNTLGTRGNLPPEMSLSNYAHKSDDRATGLERESGIGKNPDKTTVAHNKGTAYYANMKGVDMTDDAAIEEALDYKVTEQINQGRIAAETDAPRQAALRELTGNDQLYRGPVPKDLVLDREDVLKSYDALRYNGGTVRINNRALRRTAALLPAAGGLIGLNQMSAQAAQGDYMGAAATGIETAVGEIPVVGDALVNEFQGRSAGAGSDVPSTAAQRQMVEDYEATPASKIVNKPLNELEWAAKNPVEALKNIRENDAVKATGAFLRNVGGSILIGF